MTHRQTGSAQIGAMRTGQQASLPVQVQAPCFAHDIVSTPVAADGQHSADVIAQSEISQPHSALPTGCRASNCYCMSYAQDT